MSTIATTGHDGHLAIILMSQHVELTEDADADLDAVLAVDDHLVLCERCGTFVDEEDSGDSEVTTETICLSCYIAEQAEQEAIRAEVDADLDAMHAQHAWEAGR